MRRFQGRRGRPLKVGRIFLLSEEWEEPSHEMRKEAGPEELEWEELLRGKVRKAGTGQIMHGLLGHSQEFGFYSKWE